MTAATFWKIDTARWFRASVAAGLLRIEVGPGPLVHEVPVYSRSGSHGSRGAPGG